MAHREEAAPGRAASSPDTIDGDPRRPPGARSGAVLLLGTLTSNVLSYAFFAVLSRTLSGDDLGAVGSLVNLSVLAGVPALGLQLVAARLVSRAMSGDGASEGRPGPGEGAAATATAIHGVMRASAGLGLLTAVAVAALSPVLAHLLHLSPLMVVVVGAAMLPTAVVFAAQGVLQGSERFVRLAVVLAGAGVAKFAAAWIAARAGGGVVAVITLFALGWVVVAGVALALLPRAGLPLRALLVPRRRSEPYHHHDRPRHPELPHHPERPRHLARLVAAAVVPTSGLLFLSSLDVLLARHHLAPEASGAYTVAALFEKAAFWGLGFLATLFYPAMAQQARRRAALLRALAVTAGAGAVGVGLTALLGTWLVTLVGGPGYAALGPGLWRFTALGVCLALVQVIAYAGVAAATTPMGVAMWLAGGLAVALTSAHHADVDAVVDVMLVVSVSLVLVGLVIERRSLLGAGDPDGEDDADGTRGAPDAAGTRP
ncbi:lipopolysaccharide biosynthesis protein [Humibacillus xanthopallidus]|nr:oligosaccharide flippase family protein [Humibacillus xanthopallidus]